MKNNVKELDRNKISFRGNMIGIFTNFLLFVFKFLTGSFVNSVSIIADSYNNLTDCLSNVISMVGMKLSLLPADEKHPFGYGRIEYISASLVSFLVLQVGLFSLINSIKKFISQEDIQVELVVLIILFVSICVKIALWAYYKYLYKKIDSDIFMAMSNDCISDSLITTGTFLAMLIEMQFNLNLDSEMGVIVSIIIIINGIKIIKETLKPLIGEQIDENLYMEIQSFVKKYPEVIDTHDLIIHNYGPNKYMCSIHVEVDKKKDIEYLHEIIDKIEKDIYIKKNLLLVIHLDPIDLDNKKVIEYKEMIKNLLVELEKKYEIDSLSFHDLRCVFGKENTNVIFDIVIPWSLDKNKVSELIEDIKKSVKQKNKSLSVVMNVDREY